MTVVVVDERGRLTIPSELQVRDTKAALIPAGPFMMIIPLPLQPVEASCDWLRSKASRKELKALAEIKARKDAVNRTRKRRQLR
jgi:hypothetical protein